MSTHWGMRIKLGEGIMKINEIDEHWLIDSPNQSGVTVAWDHDCLYPCLADKPNLYYVITIKLIKPSGVTSRL